MATVNLAPTFGCGWQGFTSSGIPLNAGKLYTYAAGSTTPQATYTTSAGNVQCANPIRLAADGRTSTEVWFVAGLSYRVDVTDSLDNLIQTYDNLIGVNDTPTYQAQNVAAAIGADATATQSIATGLGADATATQTIATGISGDATASQSIATGIGSDATATSSISSAISGSSAMGSDFGYPNIPQNSQTGTTYVTVLADQGKHIFHPATDNNPATFTIAANGSVAYQLGTVITFVNLINTLTIAINSDTLTWAQTNGTGSRTLAAGGVATALKVTMTNWLISGTGLT